MRHVCSVVYGVLCGAVLLIGPSAQAQSSAGLSPLQQKIEVQAWARATPSGSFVTAAYLSLRAPQDDRLLSISSSQASTVSLHHMVMQGDIMTMRPIENGVALPAHKLVSLQPNGDHAMVQGLHAPLHRGDLLHLHLIFQHALPMDIDAPVRGMGDQE